MYREKKYLCAINEGYAYKILVPATNNFIHVKQYKLLVVPDEP